MKWESEWPSGRGALWYLDWIGRGWKEERVVLFFFLYFNYVTCNIGQHRHNGKIFNLHSCLVLAKLDFLWDDLNDGEWCELDCMDWKQFVVHLTLVCVVGLNLSVSECVQSTPSLKYRKDNTTHVSKLVHHWSDWCRETKISDLLEPLILWVKCRLAHQC